jgi:hypothetical protein
MQGAQIFSKAVKSVQNLTRSVFSRPNILGREADLIFQSSLKEIQADEYLAWLCQVLGGFLSPGDGNIAGLSYAIKNMPENGAVIEIGSFLGLSTNIIAYLTMKHGRKNQFFSCDPWVFEETAKPVGGYFDASSIEFREYVKNVFRLSLEIFSRDRMPHAIESTSEQFRRDWDSVSAVNDIFGRVALLGGPISFAYIDGAHTYEAAKHDFLGIDRHLLPGGFMLFDDSSDGSSFECKKVVADVISNPMYELAFTTPNYLFRKRRC